MGTDSSTQNQLGFSRLGRSLRASSDFGIQLGRQTLELLLPSTCRLCDACVECGADFCADCGTQLQTSKKLMQFACLKCGRPGAGPARDGDHCTQCEREKHVFDSCIALWTYDGLVRNAVVAAKYGSQIALADALGRRLADRIRAVIQRPNDPSGESAPDLPDLITAVPSHLWRRVQRGAGGSRLLASSVARTLHLVWPNLKFADLLATTRKIKKQAWLGEKQRLSNVRGAFRTSRATWPIPNRTMLSGKHVLLIDDVMTTGATAGENAKVLKDAGARRVTVAVVARACSG